MPEEKKKQKKEEQKQQNVTKQSIGLPDKIIPKLCTHINFGVTQDKHVIIGLTFESEEQNILIERVVVTYEHAKTIVTVLSDLIERVEKNGTTIQKSK